MNKTFFLLYIISSIAISATAQETAQTVQTEILSKSSTSWDGSNIPDYPEGQPEITIAKITIPAGLQLPVHKHPNPLGGVVLQGELTVIREDGKRHSVKAGESIIEVVNTWHYGKNEGDIPVVLIAFYIGVQDQALTILKEN